MADTRAIETWAGALLHKLQPTQRRRLLIDIARRLRTDNTQRMRAQTGPDGQPWPARKAPAATLRSKRAQLRQQAKQKRPMFAKLRRAKYLKARGKDDAAVVEFAGRAARIAAVHHFGQDDHVTPGGPIYRYPARELLGITAADADAVRDALLQHLAGR